MPNWIHRTTLRYIRSVPLAELPEIEANYIQDPDLSAVAGQPVKYWEIIGDTVALKDAAGRQAADDAETAAVVQDSRDEALRRKDVDVGTRALLGELAFQLEKAFKRIQELQDTLTAIKGTAGGSDNIRGAIPTPSNVSNPAPAQFTRVPPDLPRSDLMQGYVDRINAGQGDP